MIHIFKIFFSCFYDWIYLIAFKCIIHCQVLATTWEKEKQAWSDISAWNQAFKMCGQLYHFAPCTGQNDTVHGAKWYTKTFLISDSNIQDVAQK